MPSNSDPSPPDYPGRSQVGQTRLWDLPSEGEPCLLNAVFLGFSSSRSDRHRHPAGTTAPPGSRCSGCRWTEFRIYREDTEPHCFYLHTVGRSVVKGESDLPRLSDPILTATEVISHLTRRLPGATPFLTVPADMVLAQASHYDEDVREAYNSRAVL